MRSGLPGFSVTQPSVSDLLPPTFQIVNNLGDFPEPVGGKITLAENTTYFVTNQIDIGDNTICYVPNSAILGASRESAVIIASGSNPVFSGSSNHTLSMITVNCTNTTVVDVDGENELEAFMNWTDSAIISTGGCVLGTVRDTPNCLLFSVGTTGLADGWTFEGDFQSIVFDSTSTAAVTDDDFVWCTIPASTTISSRVRTSFSSYDVSAAANGRAFSIGSSGSFNLSESFQLTSNVLSSSLDPVDGLDDASTVCLWDNNIGTPDTRNAGALEMISNATPTVFSVISTPVKVLGSTSPFSLSRFIEAAENRLTFVGPRRSKFYISANFSILGAVGVDYSLRIRKNGTTDLPGARANLSAIGGSAIQSTSIQTTVSLDPGDYVELWMANDSNLVAATVTDMTLICHQF
jgi:hypothetical protein